MLHFQQGHNSILTNSETFMIPSSTGWVQSTENISLFFAALALSFFFPKMDALALEVPSDFLSVFLTTLTVFVAAG